MIKLVTLEQAIELKKLGFDSDRFEFCFDVVGDVVEVGLNYEDNVGYKVFYISEALDWFREVKGVTCAVDFYAYKDSITYSGVIYNGEDNLYTNDYENHGEASSALLDALIEYEMNKSK